jgi:tRNA-splicing ligase RtcB (3'-phosphate/5'-hydroxy nucleic acid ligase)
MINQTSLKLIFTRNRAELRNPFSSSLKRFSQFINLSIFKTYKQQNLNFLMDIKQISKNIWEIPKQGKMLVPGRIYASKELIGHIKKDKTLDQVKNVACLPGIVNFSLAMPDAHQGYGFPIGGVAAFDLKKGIVSPGGVGYDINCGVRLLSTNLDKKEFLKKREPLLAQLAKDVPSGVGKKSDLRLSQKELDEVLKKGTSWCLEKEYCTKDDVEKTEDSGCIKNANPKKVSQKAKGRGMNQLGSLGSGNHFLEIQEVEKIYNKEDAKTFGIKKTGQITILVHSGSRGLGHQVASDYIRAMEKEYGIKNLPDRELTYAPINSQLGKDYFEAMSAAANFAFANRQLITHEIRKVFGKFFPNSKLKLVYDIAHNIAKFEEHTLNEEKTTLCIHRKGATRSFGPNRKELPKAYQKTGSPIFIPGSMGTFSYVLKGTKKAEEISFGSTAHGAGRILSRTFAKKNLSIDKVKENLKNQDILIKTNNNKDFLEEAPEAYKDVNEVVKVSNELQIGELVARLKPLGVIKG